MWIGIGYLFLAWNSPTYAQNPTAKVSTTKMASVSCDGGLKFSGLAPHAPQITFSDKVDSTSAKLNGMEECKANAGKFYCYHANSETMINIPLDIGKKKSGDKIVVFVNDDADDVHGNGKSYHCTVD